MKPANTNIGKVIRKSRALILLGTLAAVASTIACSGGHKSSANSGQTVHAAVRPAVVEPAAPKVAPVDLSNKDAAASKAPLAKQITFKSRNYGVSFAYPRQYAYLSAKVVAEGDARLQPKSDGHDGQFTLARIDVPKGFFPDTDLESGYFALSLNQDIDQAACEASLSTAKDAKVQTDSINGVDFKWLESESGGRGSASKMRYYVAFTNGMCYEVELGVKTSNESGLAREVDPDQVMRRLDSILRTVKIQQATQPGPQLLSSNDTQQN